MNFGLHVWGEGIFETFLFLSPDY